MSTGCHINYSFGDLLFVFHFLKLGKGLVIGIQTKMTFLAEALSVDLVVLSHYYDAEFTHGNELDFLFDSIFKLILSVSI